MDDIGNSTESTYGVLIADLVASREQGGRAEVQRLLLSSLRDLSEQHADRLVAPLAATAGDEFEGLFRDASVLVQVARDLSDRLHPVRLTFGLGWGTLATSIPHRRAQRRVAELDGPVFHRARAALTRARADGQWLAVEGFGEAEDVVLSALGQAVGAVRERWTDKQARTVAAARSSSQKDVARQFDVSPSVVSESLKAAQFDVVKRLEDALSVGLVAFSAGGGRP